MDVDLEGNARLMSFLVPYAAPTANAGTTRTVPASMPPPTKAPRAARPEVRPAALRPKTEPLAAIAATGTLTDASLAALSFRFSLYRSDVGDISLVILILAGLNGSYRRALFCAHVNLVCQLVDKRFFFISDVVIGQCDEVKVGNQREPKFRIRKFQEAICNFFYMFIAETEDS